jgi:hypothetical protein
MIKDKIKTNKEIKTIIKNHHNYLNNLKKIKLNIIKSLILVIEHLYLIINKIKMKK